MLGHINYDNLVKFDPPDGSTSLTIKNNILVNFNHPDGSTCWGHINYDNLV